MKTEDEIIKQIKALGFKEDPVKFGYCKDIDGKHQLFFSQEMIISGTGLQPTVVKSPDFIDDRQHTT